MNPASADPASADLAGQWLRLELGHLADEVGVEGTARVVSVSSE